MRRDIRRISAAVDWRFAPKWISIPAHVHAVMAAWRSAFSSATTSRPRPIAVPFLMALRSQSSIPEFRSAGMQRTGLLFDSAGVALGSGLERRVHEAEENTEMSLCLALLLAVIAINWCSWKPFKHHSRCGRHG